MHGYKWPIHCTRTRTAPIPSDSDNERTGQRVRMPSDHFPVEVQFRLTSSSPIARVRFYTIGTARIKCAGKFQSCMVSKLPIIWKQTVDGQGTRSAMPAVIQPATMSQWIDRQKVDAAQFLEKCLIELAGKY